MLGFSLALGQLVGPRAMGFDVIGPTPVRLRPVSICLYLANVINTVIYDAVYAHQDPNDDIQAGVKSVAVTWQERTKTILSFLAATEIGLLELAAWLAGFGYTQRLL